MAFYHRSGERKRISHEFRRQEEEVIGSLCRLASRPISPKSLLEQEKRIRREIANSNERRRMQNINAGFQSLRTLLPHREGEKLSKAEILQSASDYIYQLEQEKTRLLEENCQFKRRVLNSQSNQDSDGSCSDSPLLKRKKKHVVDSADEGVRCSSPGGNENSVDDLKKELAELRQTLEKERTLRLLLVEQIKSLESQLYIVDNSAHDSVDYLTHQSETEETKISASVINMTIKKEPHNPSLSNQDVENSQNMLLAECNPEQSTFKVLDDASVKNYSVVLPYVSDLTISELSEVSTSHLSPLLSSSITSAVDQNNVEYKVSTSRQNLETIVEAIRHVEGDHMFRDDPKPIDPLTTRLDKPDDNTLCDKEQSHHRIHVVTHPDFSFRRQLIQNGPVCQSRPGVIVSNHS